MSVFRFGKSVTVTVFVCFPTALFICVRHKQSSYLVFRTTKVKDTKLTLAVIPLKQLFKTNLALQTHEEKVAQFPFLSRYIIP